MASEQQRARQLALAASAAIGDEPGIQVTPQGNEDGFRVVIQPLLSARLADYERGRNRLVMHLLPMNRPEVLYVDAAEWRALVRRALDEVAKREEDAAQTAEHTTANLPRPSVLSTCGTRITRTYDGIGEVSAVATVPNSRLPALESDNVPHPVLDAVGGLGLNVIGVPRLSVIKGGNA